MKLSILLLFFISTFSVLGQETSPLILAIRSNNLTQVKSLVAAGTDVNEEEFGVDSPLEEAIRNDRLEIVKFLVQSGARDHYSISRAVSEKKVAITNYLIEQKFSIGEAVVNAAENNDLAMVKLLVENGAKVNFSQKRRAGLFRKYYVSPIDEAISHDNLEMVELFIKHGVPLKEAIESALISGKNKIILALSKSLDDKQWLLIQAFSRENDLIVTTLINQGIPPNAEDENGNSMLLLAASQGNLIRVKKCVEDYKLYILKKNNFGENALMRAAESGSYQVCSYLLDKGITIDAQNNKGETALFYALKDDARSIFDFLVSKGAKINHITLDGNTILLKAAILGQGNTIDYLISEGANIHHTNKEGKTAFYYIVSNASAFSSNESLQDAFIAAGANINTPDGSGETLLFKEIERGTMERIQFLLSKGADANTQDHKGERPSCNKSEVIKLLIEKGADLNAIDDWDDTYLCTAIKQNDLELAHFLVNRGIDVNMRCYFKEQAIVKAIKEKNAPIVRFLAENGAELNALGYGSKTVMDYAQSEGDEEIIAYLRSRGAMTKEERNKQYEAAMKLESEIKAALISEDLEAIISLMSTQDVVILQEKVVQNIAYVAAKKGHSQMMNKLLSGAVDFNINAPINANGQTVLFIATMYNQDEMVMDLLAKGASSTQKDSNEKIALDYASKKSTKKIFNKWEKNN